MFGNKKSKAKRCKEEAHWAHKPLPNNSLSGQFLLELYLFIFCIHHNKFTFKSLVDRSQI